MFIFRGFLVGVDLGICVVFLHLASVADWGSLAPRIDSVRFLRARGITKDDNIPNTNGISSLVMPQSRRNSSEASRGLPVSPSGA